MALMQVTVNVPIVPIANSDGCLDSFLKEIEIGEFEADARLVLLKPAPDRYWLSPWHCSVVGYSLPPPVASHSVTEFNNGFHVVVITHFTSGGYFLNQLTLFYATPPLLVPVIQASGI